MVTYDTTHDTTKHLDTLYARYSELMAREDMTVEEKNREARRLRRSIRLAGGSVRELKAGPTYVQEVMFGDDGESNSEDNYGDSDDDAGRTNGSLRTSRPANKTRRSRTSTGSALLGYNPYATPAKEGQIYAITEELKRLGVAENDPSILETTYGYGFTVLSDSSGDIFFEKFRARWNRSPEWFVVHTPPGCGGPDVTTLLIMGPTP